MSIKDEYHKLYERYGSHFWDGILLYIGFMIAFGMFYIFALYKTSEKSDSKKKSPNYGIAGDYFVGLLIRFGFTSLGLQVLYGLIFIPITYNDDLRTQMPKSFISISDIFMPVQFIYLLTMFVILSITVRFFSKRNADLMMLNGNEKVYVVSGYRGSAPIEIAKKLNDGGSVHIADPFMSNYCTCDSDWVIENSARENVPIERIKLYDNGKPWNLPMKTGEMDVVVSNYTAIKFGESILHPYIASELFRVLKPGGKMIFIRLMFADDIETKCQKLGITIKKKNIHF